MTTTYYSQTDLATRMLRDLGLVDARITPDGDDIVWAKETITTVAEQLKSEGIVIWNGSDLAVPPEYLGALSKRIGLDIGPSFGLFSIAEAEQAKPVLNMTLRRMNAKPATGVVQEAEYF
jgi:hypothetical protein